mgnify:CR=1 FL=1
MGKLEENMENIKKMLSCAECLADYIIMHDKKNIIEYCPMCGCDVEEPEEDDGEFEMNFFTDDYE